MFRKVFRGYIWLATEFFHSSVHVCFCLVCSKLAPRGLSEVTLMMCGTCANENAFKAAFINYMVHCEAYCTTQSQQLSAFLGCQTGETTDTGLRGIQFNHAQSGSGNRFYKHVFPVVTKYVVMYSCF